jgi:UDP-N-acetylglucosamine/UDP-N-acetylgalactosamine diphosphorylase
VVIVAGGQGTRLGFDGPKGCFPIGPVTDRSLFQIHCERVAALGRRYGVTPPLYVMTSDDNHSATEGFLTAHGRFGLEHLRLFTQGTMPAVDSGTGAVLLAERDRVALSPDGHGGTLRALHAAGCIEEMRGRGIDTLFYLQVDNPLVRIGDPAFLGAHSLAGAEVSSKVVRKHDPAEKVGVVAERAGRQCVIEYSDLPDELAEQRADDGRLAYAAGSIALHVFALDFVARVAREAELPYHRALKPVPYVDEDGRRVEPEEPNAVKFEQFIFDTLPLARHALVLETGRAEEFEPLKNASGGSSPETVRRRLSEAAAAVLEEIGATVARDADGAPVAAIELSPLLAADREELARRVPPGTVIDADVTLL